MSDTIRTEKGQNQRNYRHGLSHHPLYRTWVNMIDRCTNPNHKAYSYYGARGISVCPEWQEHPEPFITWALANGYEAGLTIDRTDNSQGYHPSNVRFVTKADNNRNRSRPTSWRKASGLPLGVKKKSNRYIAQAYINGVKRYLGCFKTPEDAHNAYLSAIQEAA